MDITTAINMAYEKQAAAKSKALASSSKPIEQDIIDLTIQDSDDDMDLSKLCLCDGVRYSYSVSCRETNLHEGNLTCSTGQAREGLRSSKPSDSTFPSPDHTTNYPFPSPDHLTNHPFHSLDCTANHLPYSCCIPQNSC
jgi:hypothetical protein